MKTPQKEHVGWIDLLRVIACFLVVLSHCCDAFVGQFDTDRGAFLAGSLTGSLMRSSVPLFVMMTGVLMFPIRMGMAEFYKKRIKRIIIPLIFWSLALPILFFLYFNYINPATLSPIIDLNNYTTEATLSKFYLFIFNFGFDTTPLWYLYMLVGLYLVAPIIGAWLNQASKKDIKVFLYIWAVSLILPYIQMLAPILGYEGNYGSMGIWGVSFWNEFGSLYYCSGFIGYLVLAHYLIKYPLDWSWNRTLGTAIPMFLIGYLITAVGFLVSQEHYPGNYANLEIIWYFSNINVCMMTFALFILVQKIKITTSRRLSHMASLSFGIFLCHFIFVQVAYDLFNFTFPVPPMLRIAGMAIVSYLVSYLVTSIMARFKLTRCFIA